MGRRQEQSYFQTLEMKCWVRPLQVRALQLPFLCPHPSPVVHSLLLCSSVLLSFLLLPPSQSMIEQGLDSSLLLPCIKVSSQVSPFLVAPTFEQQTNLKEEKSGALKRDRKRKAKWTPRDVLVLRLKDEPCFRDYSRV